MKAINIKMKRPTPSHLKSVVLANPPLLLLFESLISMWNVTINLGKNQ
jgi:hypothetical protein